MDQSRRLLVWAIVGLLGWNLLLNGASSAAATQDGPTWAAGNQWTYRSTSYPNTTQTMTLDTIAVVAVGSTNYVTWHAWTNLTTTSSGGTTTFTIDGWLTTDGLQVVKTQSVYPSAGTVTATYSPPEPALVFALSPGTSWFGNSTVTTTTNSGTTTTTTAWSGQVTSEVSVTVPAGTFDAAVVRSPATGAPYVLVYYAQTAGWAVKLEMYDAGSALTDTFRLVSYAYVAPSMGGLSPLLYWALPLAVAVAVAIVAIALLLRWERRRPELRIARLPEEDLHHIETDVQARVVGELERAHRHVRPQLHRLVDVFDARDALLEEVERLVHHRHEEAIHDESRGFLHLDGVLAEFRAQALDEGYRLIRRLGAADHLDQFHDRRGVEEVHPHHPVRPLRRVRHLRDAQGRRIRGEHDLGRAEAVELGVERLLHLHLLKDRLDDDLRPRDGLLQVDGPADLRQDGVDLALGHLAPLDALCERLLDPPEAPVDETLLDVPHRHREPGRGARLGDPRPHRARADHRDLPYVRCVHGRHCPAPGTAPRT